MADVMEEPAADELLFWESLREPTADELLFWESLRVRTAAERAARRVKVILLLIAAAFIIFS